MRIFKQDRSSPLFMLKDISDEQLIAENDINRNYRLYMQDLLKMPDDVLLKHAPGPDAAKVRESIELQITTAIAYELAFAEILAASQDLNPHNNKG